MPTLRLYWEDDHCFQAQARVAAIQDHAIAFDRTCFCPGGGGQPSDQGTIAFAGGQVLEIVSVTPDEQGVLWHLLRSLPPHVAAGQTVTLTVNREKRVALSCYHTVLHIVNTIA